MNDQTYYAMSKAVSRFAPSHDCDVLHDAYVETQSESPIVLVGRAKWRACDERDRLARLRPEYLRRCRHVPLMDAPDTEALRKEICAVVQAVIHDLPQQQQQLARMRWWDGLEPDEIAQKLGRPRATIYTQLRRLGERLAENCRLVSLSSPLRENKQ